MRDYYRKGRTYTSTQLDEQRDTIDYLTRTGANSGNRWWARRKRSDRVYVETGPGAVEYDRSDEIKKERD